MNLLLLEESDLIDANRAVVSGRRLAHMLQIQKVQRGDFVRAGLLGGLMGHAEIITQTVERIELRLNLTQTAPPKLPITLVLALPRPKMLKRILQCIAAMGVPKIILINSGRVEKSFWQTPVLQPATVQEQLCLGLEQACDTKLPEVLLEKRFKPFVEDRLTIYARDTLGLVSHPGMYPDCPRATPKPITLAVGPEGGWSDYELAQFTHAGLAPVQLGPRILRVEQAIPTLLARLF